MNYVCLKRNAFQDPPYEIVPIRHQDLPVIKTWRNDQIDILRQNHPLTDEQQERYRSEVLEPSFDAERPAQILFSYLLEGRCIGYGGLTHIDWDCKRAEVSFLLETERTNNSDIFRKEFLVFLALIREVAFGELDLNRLFTETYAIRPHVIKLLEAFGFEREGILKQHVYIQGQYVDSLIHGYLRNGKI